MTESKVFHPVLVMQTAEMIHVLKLGQRNQNGAYPIPDLPFTHVGDVASLTTRVPDLRRKATSNATRLTTSWFAHTLDDVSVAADGYTSRNKAVAGLLAYLGYVQVKGTDTMEPLFELEKN
jgi:hypothetical protein